MHSYWGFSVRLQFYKQGKESASCVSSLAMESSGPCLTINNHLLQRSCSQVSVCPPSFLSFSIYQDGYLECLLCLYVSLSPFSSLPSPHTPLQSRAFFFSLCPSSVLLCVCSRGHSAFSADIVHCFFPGGGWVWDRSDFLSLRNTGGTATHYSMYCTAWQQLCRRRRGSIGLCILYLLEPVV